MTRDRAPGTAGPDDTAPPPTAPRPRAPGGDGMPGPGAAGSAVPVTPGAPAAATPGSPGPITRRAHDPGSDPVSGAGAAPGPGGTPEPGRAGHATGPGPGPDAASGAVAPAGPITAPRPGSTPEPGGVPPHVPDGGAGEPDVMPGVGGEPPAVASRRPGRARHAARRGGPGALPAAVPDGPGAPGPHAGRAPGTGADTASGGAGSSAATPARRGGPGAEVSAVPGGPGREAAGAEPAAEGTAPPPARGRHARRGAPAGGPPARRGGEEGGGGARLGRVLVRAAAVTGALTVAGAVLGLLRDQTIAHLFGASAESDAFLIAWTVPEMASTLLIEDAMALLLVPAFSHALAARDPGAVRALVSATFPRLFAVLTCVAVALMAGAPLVVRLLAPGFDDPELAVECTRLTALTVLTFGVTGYCSAALRAHGSFLQPAAVYSAYNVGIIGVTLALHQWWGVRAAAAGVAAGGVLMILVQLPAFARNIGLRPLLAPLRAPLRAPAGVPLLGAAVLAPVVLFAVSRQSQVLVERFLAAPLPAGAISHLNYAQKVAQMPMVLSLMVCTVTFPVVARAMAEGDRERARRRVEEDLATAGALVLLGTAFVIGYAPGIIEVLFQRGAFDAQDTATTAAVMRVYAAGLLGHCLVGALGRPFFSSGRPTWYPAAAMAAGLAVTVAAGAAAVGPYGVHGIAAANAAGITATAVLLLHGLGSRVVAIEVRAIGVRIARLLLAAAAAVTAALLTAPLTGGPVLSLAAGALLVPAVFLGAARALGAPEALHLLALVRRRLRHDH